MATSNDSPPPSFQTRATIAVEKIALRSLSTGNFAWFVLLAIGLGGIWKLDSKDLKDVLLQVLVTYGWLGYPVAGLTIFVSIRILKWRERFYNQEMTRISEVRNTLMQGKFELPMSSTSQIKPTDQK